MTTPRTPDSKRNRRLRQRRPWRTLLPSPRAALRVGGRGLRRALPLLLTLLGLGGAAYGAVAGTRWLRTSPRFALKTITVTGNQHVTREEIVRRARLEPGRNVFALSPQAIERDLAKSPWVAKVEVDRRLPDGIGIAIEERRPTALLMVDGGVYLCDAEGRPFKRAGIDEGAGLTIVSGLDRKIIGSHPDLAAGAIKRAVAIAELWRAGRDRPAVGEVHIDHGSVTLYTLEGAVAVDLGRATVGGDAAMTAAMSRFDAIWAALAPEERAAARTIHLDSRTRPDRVTVTVSEPR